MKDRVKSIGILLGWLLLTSGGPLSAWAESPLEGRLIIPGEGNQEMFKVVAERFEGMHPGVEVDIPESVGSEGGIRDVAEGEVLMARVTRPPHDRELRSDMSYMACAMSPVVFAVHPGAGDFTGLTTSQLQKIYSGEITDRRMSEGGRT